MESRPRTGLFSGPPRGAVGRGQPGAPGGRAAAAARTLGLGAGAQRSCPPSPRSGLGASSPVGTRYIKNKGRKRIFSFPLLP